MNKKSEVLDKASVVRRVGNTVHCINPSPLISATKSYRVKQRIVMYSMKSAIHPSDNGGLGST